MPRPMNIGGSVGGRVCSYQKTWLSHVLPLLIVATIDIILLSFQSVHLRMIVFACVLCDYCSCTCDMYRWDLRRVVVWHVKTCEIRLRSLRFTLTLRSERWSQNWKRDWQGFGRAWLAATRLFSWNWRPKRSDGVRRHRSAARSWIPFRRGRPGNVWFSIIFCVMSFQISGLLFLVSAFLIYRPPELKMFMRTCGVIFHLIASSRAVGEDAVSCQFAAPPITRCGFARFGHCMSVQRVLVFFVSMRSIRRLSARLWRLPAAFPLRLLQTTLHQ